MQTVGILVRLKIPDVTALTAANALRRSMGYSQLKELRRADYYRLELAVDTQEQALELARELAEKTNLFVNPNKHVYELWTSREEAAPAEGTLAHVLVTDPHDGSAEGMLSALQGRLGYGGKVTGLTKGLLWTMVLDTSDAEEAKRLASEMAETKSLDKGLLVNPHFQEFEVW
ncbi:MAG: phosphoribosylformylglycinamidine synthase subunit PurS [Armatimonadia bacterium]